MTTITNRRPREGLLTPLAAAGLGFAVYVAALSTGERLDLNANPDATSMTVSDWAAGAVIALVGVGIAVWSGHRALTGGPDRLARTALVLALVAAATFVVFWAGWSNIFAAVAVALAVAHRRRTASLSATAAISLVVASSIFVAATYLCVTG
jgi:hypothetical protein